MHFIYAIVYIYSVREPLSIFIKYTTTVTSNKNNIFDSSRDQDDDDD